MNRKIGLVVILIALLCNEYVIARLFSFDNIISYPNSGLILMFQIVLILFGLLMIMFYRSALFRKIIIILFITFFLYFIIEVISYFIFMNNTPVIIESIDKNYYDSDDSYGYVLKPDFNTICTKTYNNDTAYNVVYTNDKKGRRIVLGNNDSSSMFCAVFGCSRVFGVGLNDNETLPFFIQQKTKKYSVYNYGVPGYGIHQIYSQLINRNFKEDLTQDYGVGILLLTTDHLWRSIGSYYVYNLWGRNMPYYQIINDKLVQNGSFTSGRLFRSLIYSLLDKSYLLKLFKFNWPLKLSESDYKLCSKMIIDGRNQFLKEFPKSEFYIIIYPGNEMNEISALLKEESVDVVDLFIDKSVHSVDKQIFLDGHPNGKMNELLAEKIFFSLKLYK